MRVFELLDELNEMVEAASNVPLSKKVAIDPSEMMDVIKEIKDALPDELSKAQWIMDEREKILSDAKNEYKRVIDEAKERAEKHIAADEITLKAKQRAEDLLVGAKENCSVMKMSVLDYTDNMLYNLQEKLDEIKAIYFEDMYNDLNNTFEKMYANIAGSRAEVKNQIYKTQQEEKK